MIRQMKKYLREDIDLSYLHSMYTIRTKLASSFIDDSRPTSIQLLSEDPAFYLLLAGKINSIYEIEKFIR
tara:strand:- start:417 stop:626 length:210 start_codon:yes stop_codon:yes gene_type:complete